MNKLLSFFLLVLFCTNSYSQTENKQLYSGGMLIFQPGKTYTSNNHQNIQDFSIGVGGILRFYIGKYFTAGIYGGTIKTNYNSTNSDNSYINLGYGGPFLGISHEFNKLRFTFSGFGGKGSIKNLHIENQNINLLTEAYLYKHSVWVFSPIFSIDYSLTKKISFTFQSIYLFSEFENTNSFKNVTIQFGVLFRR